MDRLMVETLLFLVGLTLFVGLPWLAWRRLRAGRPAVAARPLVADGAGGWIVPLVAGFGGVRGLPWIGVASNNFNPRLVVTPTGITCRVLRLRHHAFADIARVDLRRFGATVILSFAFRDGILTFDANVGSDALAADVLALLPAGVPLSDRARAHRGAGSISPASG